MINQYHMIGDILSIHNLCFKIWSLFSTMCFSSARLIFLSYLWRYWWLKLKSLAEKEDWEELEKFSKTKKSPIGYLVRITLPLIYIYFFKKIEMFLTKTQLLDLSVI